MAAVDIGAERDSLYKSYDNQEGGLGTGEGGSAERSGFAKFSDRPAARQPCVAARRSGGAPPSARRAPPATNASLAAYQGDTPSVSPRGASNLQLLTFDELLTFRVGQSLTVWPVRYNSNCSHLSTHSGRSVALSTGHDTTRFTHAPADGAQSCAGTQRSTTRSASDLAVSASASKRIR